MPKIKTDLESVHCCFLVGRYPNVVAIVETNKRMYEKMFNAQIQVQVIHNPLTGRHSVDSKIASITITPQMNTL
jgi:hypothetical protein